jgi:hypothetical protein
MEALDQFLDGLRLVPGGLELADDLERGPHAAGPRLKVERWKR